MRADTIVEGTNLLANGDMESALGGSTIGGWQALGAATGNVTFGSQWWNQSVERGIPG